MTDIETNLGRRMMMMFPSDFYPDRTLMLLIKKKRTKATVTMANYVRISNLVLILID